MSRPILPNSPLAEVVCEVRFHGDLSHIVGWGAIQSALRDEYPKLFVPASSGMSGSPPWMQPLRLSSEDEKSAVSLAINSYGFSTKQYSSYGAFKERLMFLFGLFNRTCPLQSVTRISLRYINRLPPAFGATEERNVFRLHPSLKLAVHGLDGDVGNMRPQFVAEVVKNSVKFCVALVPPQQGVTLDTMRSQAPALHGVQLDLVGYVDGSVKATEIMPTIDRIHAVIEDGFLGIITDEYHRYLKGEINAG